jgi:hypothetical protein
MLRITSAADSAQKIQSARRRCVVTMAGNATPVAAAIQAATHMGHFGSRIASTPGNALPAAFSKRGAGPLVCAATLV